MKLIISREAAEDSEKIYDFLAKKSEIAAVKIYNQILDEIEKLSDFPQLAPMEPLLSDFSKQYRALIIRHTYKIIYYFEEETVFVVAVFDCRQNPWKLRGKINILMKKEK